MFFRSSHPDTIQHAHRSYSVAPENVRSGATACVRVLEVVNQALAPLNLKVRLFTWPTGESTWAVEALLLPRTADDDAD